MAVKCPQCDTDNPSDSKYCKECATPLPSSKEIPVTKTLEKSIQELLGGATFAGRYQIMEELGRGGMGVVYKAQDTKLKRTVALKFLPPELTHISEVKERFIREAQAAAALDHPNICTVYEFDEAEEKTFISMAFIEGQSLKEKIESGPLELDEGLGIATQVAEGLQEAHKKGVVHRDIKSANIMVTEKGQSKVMDFGLARMTEGTLVTKEGTTMGTVAYMSPEQARGEEVDHRTDIWSLGVVLYEMFSGQLPFRGEHDQAVVYSILNKKPKSVTELKDSIPISIEQVVSKALEKNPDERYQQIEDLLEDLRSISEGIVPEGVRARLRKAKLLRRKRAILYAGIACVLVIMTVIALSIFTGLAGTIDSIAVLPLENLTGDSEQEYFVDGVTDELIGQLGQISGLRRVISRTSIMRYKETDKSLSEIARELNVDAVIEGSVQQVGDNVRVRVQLIDALPQEQNLWGQTYERARNDVLVMYSEMARAIVDEIQVKLTPEEEMRLASTRQVNPEAYKAFLKGQFHWYKLTPPDLEAALQYFQSALEIDPNYALAHTGIAMVWAGRAQMAHVPSSEAAPKAKEAILKALELDDTLAEVHHILASFRTWIEYDWEGGEAAFRRAIEINPNYPDAHAYYSNLLCHLRRPDEALAQAERALELDPLNSLFQDFYGNVLGYMSRYDDAIVQFRNAIKTSPNDPVGYLGLMDAFHMKGMYEEAMVAAKAAFAAIGVTELEEVLARGYQEAGYLGAMSLLAETLAALSQETFIGPYFIAQVFAYAGKKEQVLEWLEKAYEAKDPSLPYMNSRSFDILREDSRYHDLLRRMNLPQWK